MTSKSVGLLLTLALPSFAHDKEETKRGEESSDKKKKKRNEEKITRMSECVCFCLLSFPKCH